MHDEDNAAKEKRRVEEKERERDKGEVRERVEEEG